MVQPVVAVLVAAGMGLRYGGPTPKPALRLTGKALIALSIEAMAAGGCTDAVVVVSPESHDPLQQALAGSPIPVSITLGGKTRQESVGRGIEFVRNDPHLSQASAVLIHDAVRPMVPATVVEAVIAAVHEGVPAVTPAIPLADSIRAVGEGPNESTVVDRSTLRAIQTPQGFPLDVIARSHDLCAESGQSFTDDVSCAEAAGYPVTIIEGSRLAMKITEPTDLTIAKSLWKIRASIGHHSGRRIWRHWRHAR